MSDGTNEAPAAGHGGSPPTVAVVCMTVIALAVLGCVTALILTGKDTNQLSSFIGTMLNTVSFITSGGAILYARRAAVQTNGSLDPRIRAAVSSALDERAESTRARHRAPMRGWDHQ